MRSVPYKRVKNEDCERRSTVSEKSVQPITIWHLLAFVILAATSIAFVLLIASTNASSVVDHNNLSSSDLSSNFDGAFFKKGETSFSFPKNPPFFFEKVPEYLERTKEAFVQSQESKADTIFVSIPSYRDAECSITIRNIFSKARNPERVFLGICDQIVVEEDQNDVQCRVPEEWKNNVRIVTMPASMAKGPVLARYIISKLWNGEKYYFSIDAHSNFLENWDGILVDMMSRTHEKALVTHYPVGSSNELGDNDGRIPLLCDLTFDGAPKNLFRQKCGECHIGEKIKENGLCMGTFIGAGFIFSRSTILRDAPFDRYLDWLFQGEEVLWAARLWTSGWRFYSPSTNVINHVYGFRKHSVFSENRDTQRSRESKIAAERVYYLLGLRDSPPVEAPEIESLGMGSEASLEEYLEFSGVNLKTKEFKKKCYKRYDEGSKQWM